HVQHEVGIRLLVAPGEIDRVTLARPRIDGDGEGAADALLPGRGDASLAERHLDALDHQTPDLLVAGVRQVLEPVRSAAAVVVADHDHVAGHHQRVTGAAARLRTPAVERAVGPTFRRAHRADGGA